MLISIRKKQQSTLRGTSNIFFFTSHSAVWRRSERLELRVPPPFRSAPPVRHVEIAPLQCQQPYLQTACRALRLGISASASHKTAPIRDANNTRLWPGVWFSYHGFKVGKSLNGNTHIPCAFCAGTSSPIPFTRERMLIQGVIYCPASPCFTVSAHSLTHACMLRFPETPSSSYNKVILMCICAHKDTSVTPRKTALL